MGQEQASFQLEDKYGKNKLRITKKSTGEPLWVEGEEKHVHCRETHKERTLLVNMLNSKAAKNPVNAPRAPVQMLLYQPPTDVALSIKGATDSLNTLFQYSAHRYMATLAVLPEGVRERVKDNDPLKVRAEQLVAGCPECPPDKEMTDALQKLSSCLASQKNGTLLPVLPPVRLDLNRVEIVTAGLPKELEEKLRSDLNIVNRIGTLQQKKEEGGASGSSAMDKLHMHTILHCLFYQRGVTAQPPQVNGTFQPQMAAAAAAKGKGKAVAAPEDKAAAAAAAKGKGKAVAAPEDKAAAAAAAKGKGKAVAAPEDKAAPKRKAPAVAPKATPAPKKKKPKYDVECILQHCVTTDDERAKGKYMYLIHWEGYNDVTDHTWEPEKNLTGCVVFDEYKARHNL